MASEGHYPADLCLQGKSKHFSCTRQPDPGAAPSPAFRAFESHQSSPSRVPPTQSLSPWAPGMLRAWEGLGLSSCWRPPAGLAGGECVCVCVCVRACVHVCDPARAQEQLRQLLQKRGRQTAPPSPWDLGPGLAGMRLHSRRPFLF